SAMMRLPSGTDRRRSTLPLSFSPLAGSIRGIPPVPAFRPARGAVRSRAVPCCASLIGQRDWGSDYRAPADNEDVPLGILQRRPFDAVFVEGRDLLRSQGHSPLDVGRIVRIVEVDVQRVLPLCPIVDLDE